MPLSYCGKYIRIESGSAVYSAPATLFLHKGYSARNIARLHLPLELAVVGIAVQKATRFEIGRICNVDITPIRLQNQIVGLYQLGSIR